MSSAQYYLFWLGAGLVLIAIASAIITLQMRRRELRRIKAVELLDALARYSEWVAAQGRVVFFQDDTQDVTDGALHEMRAVQREWFPQLREEAENLVAVHRRLIDFLRRSAQAAHARPRSLAGIGPGRRLYAAVAAALLGGAGDGAAAGAGGERARRGGAVEFGGVSRANA